MKTLGAKASVPYRRGRSRHWGRQGRCGRETDSHMGCNACLSRKAKLAVWANKYRWWLVGRRRHNGCGDDLAWNRLAVWGGRIRLGVATLGGTSTGILSTEAGVGGVAEETGLELATTDRLG